MRHNYYRFVASLRCDKTFNRGSKCYTTVAFGFLNIKHFNTPVVQAKVRDKVKVTYRHGYRWQGGSHHTQPIYPQERDQVLNVKEVRWAPGPA